MTTATAIQDALDAAVVAAFSASPAILFAMPNEDSTELSEGHEFYVTVRLLFNESKKTSLGCDLKRRTGVLQFVLHQRDGTGTRSSVLAYERIDSAFVDQYIGGATLTSLSFIASTEAAGWKQTAYQIPFWFE